MCFPLTVSNHASKICHWSLHTAALTSRRQIALIARSQQKLLLSWRMPIFQAVYARKDQSQIHSFFTIVATDKVRSRHLRELPAHITLRSCWKTLEPLMWGSEEKGCQFSLLPDAMCAFQGTYPDYTLFISGLCYWWKSRSDLGSACLCQSNARKSRLEGKAVMLLDFESHVKHGASWTLSENQAISRDSLLCEVTVGSWLMERQKKKKKKGRSVS